MLFQEPAESSTTTHSKCPRKKRQVNKEANLFQHPSISLALHDKGFQHIAGPKETCYNRLVLIPFKLSEWKMFFNFCAGPKPWSSMPNMENSGLLFSSCHLELVISENSRYFACYFDKCMCSWLLILSRSKYVG